MKVEVFKEAQQAYASGDYKKALEGFIACTHDVGGLAPADLSKFYHLIGNCYVKSNDPRSAAEYYLKALTGSPEKRKPSLYVNLGTALLGTKDYENALEAFGRALDYPIYTTPYKAYAGIGAAQLKLGNMVEAGAAYREAALDPANTSPAKSLVNLGVCFMELGRPDDAVSVYETALDFDLDDRAKAKAYANLGQAYMAQGRVPRALKAFETAEELGGTLPALALHDYELAKTLKEKVDPRAPGVFDTGYIPPVSGAPLPEEDPDFDPFAPSSTGGEDSDAQDGRQEVDELATQDLSQGETLDPSQAQTVAMDAIVESMPDDMIAETDMGDLDATQDIGIGSFEESPVQDQGYDSGLNETPFSYNDQPGYEYGVAFNFGDEYADVTNAANIENAEMNMPSPEETQFFEISEQQINKNAKKGSKKKRKARGCGLKIAIFFVILLILAALAAGGAYFLGYGYPLQETVVDDFMAAVENNGDTSRYWAGDVSDASRSSQEAFLKDSSSYEIEAVRRSTNQTEVFVKAGLKQGGSIDYEFVLTRKGISWAIEYVQLYFPSES